MNFAILAIALSSFVAVVNLSLYQKGSFMWLIGAVNVFLAVANTMIYLRQ